MGWLTSWNQDDDGVGYLEAERQYKEWVTLATQAGGVLISLAYKYRVHTVSQYRLTSMTETLARSVAAQIRLMANCTKADVQRSNDAGGYSIISTFDVPAEEWVVGTPTSTEQS